jgi:hypothetical protein
MPITELIPFPTARRTLAPRRWSWRAWLRVCGMPAVAMRHDIGLCRGDQDFVRAASLERGAARRLHAIAAGFVDPIRL